MIKGKFCDMPEFLRITPHGWVKPLTKRKHRYYRFNLSCRLLALLDPENTRLLSWHTMGQGVLFYIIYPERVASTLLETYQENRISFNDSLPVIIVGMLSETYLFRFTPRESFYHIANLTAP